MYSGYQRNEQTLNSEELMNQPTYEELQQKLQDTEAKLKIQEAKNKKTKEPELMVEYETGFLQIRRLTGRSINLPTWVIRWILENAQTILKFFEANKHLLAAKDDIDINTAGKQIARSHNLSFENPVVRKPRSENKSKIV